MSDALRNALIAGALAALAAGVMGVYVVIRRMVSISGSVAHASLGGVGLGLITGISPLLGALVFTPVAALVMGLVVKRTRLPEDTAIGILWASGMALGVLLASFAHATADLSTFLFGDITAVSTADLILMGALDVVMGLLVLRFHEELLSIAFDEEFSQIIGLPTRALYLLMLLLVALTVVALLRVVGIILLLALLTIPAALSRRFTHSIGTMMLLSCILSAVFTYAGLWLSLRFRLPSGAVIALLSSSTLFVFLGLSGRGDRRPRRSGSHRR